MFSANATLIPDASATSDAYLDGLDYDEEVISVPDDMTGIFVQNLGLYNSSFLTYLADYPGWGDGKGYFGGGQLLPSGIDGGGGGMDMVMGEIAEPVENKRKERGGKKFDVWNLDALNGSKDINYLRTQVKLARQSGVWGVVFTFVNNCPGLTEENYCCSGWSQHVEYNMKRLDNVEI